MELTGTGFFCHIPIGSEKFPVMITHYHIITDEFLKDNKSITIELSNKHKEININDNRLIYTNEMYNITIIEINSKKDKITQFLDLDENIFNENFYNKIKALYTIQYIEGEKIYVSYGYLRKKAYDYYESFFFILVVLETVHQALQFSIYQIIKLLDGI